METCQRIFCLLCMWLGRRRWAYAFKASIHLKLIISISVTGTVLPCKSYSRLYSIPATDWEFIFRLYGWISYNFHDVLVGICRKHPWVGILHLRLFLPSIIPLKVFGRDPTGWIHHESARSLRFGEIPVVLDSPNLANLQDFSQKERRN